IRTADAAGFDTVFLGKGTVDPYNDKVVRATQGSIFHISVVSTHLQDQIRELKDRGFDIWTTALTNSKVYHDVKQSERTALILGNEAHGDEREYLRMADAIVNIPLYWKSESCDV